MLFRLTGRLSDKNVFSTRVDAAHAVDAIVQGRKLLNDSNVPDENIVAIAATPMTAKGNAIHIGAARQRKSKAEKTPPPATQQTKGRR